LLLEPAEDKPAEDLRAGGRLGAAQQVEFERYQDGPLQILEVSGAAAPPYEHMCEEGRRRRPAREKRVRRPPN
jgi:hypothetical protein